jgi:RNA polymerase nonessential primary-like sigma factor
MPGNYSESQSMNALLNDSRRKGNRPLSREVEQRLATIIERGTNPDGTMRAGAIMASNALVVHNLRFAATVARKYAGRCGVIYDDLVAACYMGMVESSRRFRPRGIKFISYSITRMMAKCQLEMTKCGRPVTFPADALRKAPPIIRWLDKKGIDLELILMGKTTISYAQMGADIGMTAAQCEACVMMMCGHVSLNKLKTRDGDEQLIESVRSNLPDPDRDAVRWSDMDEVERLLSGLKPRDADIMRRLYLTDLGPGANNCPFDLTTVAGEVGMSRERVRQIHLESLEKMRYAAEKAERNRQRSLAVGGGR